MSSFWFIIKQQWTIEEIYIFSNISHLEWRVGLSDTILKGTHPRTIPARFGLIWFRGFRGEDLNVKVYDVRRTDRQTTTDAKWWQKLTWSLWPDELKNVKTWQNPVFKTVCIDQFDCCKALNFKLHWKPLLAAPAGRKRLQLFYYVHEEWTSRLFF